jgi:hypothetical protein
MKSDQHSDEDSAMRYKEGAESDAEYARRGSGAPRKGRLAED